MTWLIGVLLWTCLPQQAGDIPQFAQWRGADVEQLRAAIAPKINAQKYYVEQLANYGNHSVMLMYREGSGEVELHETQADVFVIESGEAKLALGGTVVGARNTGPGEVRGTSIEGGSVRNLAKGDVLHIPAKVPHQVIIEQGKPFIYLVVKIDAR